MAKSFKKKYSYTSACVPNKITSISETNNYFIFSGVPSGEFIHIGLLYGLYIQDTIKKFLGKKNNILLKGILPNFFSHTIYKELGNQIIHPKKIAQYYKKNINKLKKSWLDYSNIFPLSLSEKSLLIARKMFEKLYKENYISYKEDICNRDTHLNKEISDKDTIKNQITTHKYEIKFFVDGKGDTVSIFTEYPEFIFSAVAIAVHPKDRRYKKHVGRNVIIPIVNKKIPLITDETINMVEGQGAKLINPGHDRDGIIIAQKHNLSLQEYSLDEKGYFTRNCGRFSGKKWEDFKANIIKFLSDIGNLNTLEETQSIRSYNKYSNRELIPMKKKYANIKIGEQDISFSTYAKCGCLIPILTNNEGEIFTLTEEILEKKINKSPFTLLILHVILEGLLKSNFTLSKLLQVLGKESFNYNPKYINYIKYYEKKELKNMISYILKHNDLGKLQKLIETSPCIQYNQNGTYSVQWNYFFGTNNFIELQQELYFHQEFIEYCLYQDFFSQFTAKENAGKIYGVIDSKSNKFFNFFQENSSKPIEIELLSLPTLKNSNKKSYTFLNSKIIGNLLQEISKQYGTDIIRLLFINQQGVGNIEEIQNNIPYYDRFLQKIWNIIRLFSDQGSIRMDLDEIYNILLYARSELKDFDLWILDKTQEYYLKIQEYINQNKFLAIFPLLEEYILSHFDHYIEIHKYVGTKYSKTIAQYCTLFLLYYLEYFVPIFSYKIQEQTQYTNSIFKSIPIDVMEYKSNIFNDILLKIKELKLQNGYLKHENINISIWAGADMLVFLEEYTPVLKNFFRVNTLELLEKHKEIPSNYITDTIIDITIGIQKITTHSTKKEIEFSLGKQLEDLEDEIQRKKIFLGRIIPMGDNEKIQEKKEEIAQLKKQTETIKLRLNTL